MSSTAPLRALVIAAIAATIVAVIVVVAFPRDDKGPVRVATVEIAATADGHVDADAPETTNGSTRELRVDGEPQVRSYVRFDTETLTAQRATLRIWASSPHSQGIDVHVATPTSWSEDNLTFSNAPAIGERLASTGKFAAETWIDIDVTAALRDGSSVTLALASEHPTAAAFASHEDPSHAPRLIVQAADRGGASAVTDQSAPTVSALTGESVTVAALGDVACDLDRTPTNPTRSNPSCRQMEIGDLIGEGGYAAVLALGDLQYEDGTLEQFQQSYDPALGRFKPITFPVPGNHEYNTAGASGYYDYFGDRAGDPATGYYSFDIGAWHVVALNSNCAKVGGCEAGSAQQRWLRADLAANAQRCTIALTHHPRWVQGKYSDFDQLDDLYSTMMEFGVDVLLSGHDHSYQRFAPLDADREVDTERGIRQFVVGTGGKNHASTIVPGGPLEAADATSFGVLELQLNPTGYTWAFAPLDADGFVDAGNSACN